MLGRRVVCPTSPANQRIKLLIVGFHKGAQLKYLTNKKSKGPDRLDLKLYNIFFKGFPLSRECYMSSDFERFYKIKPLVEI